MYSKSDGFLCFHYLQMRIANDTYHVVERNGMVNAEGAEHTLAHNSCMSVCGVHSSLHINLCDPYLLNKEEHLLGSSWLEVSSVVSEWAEEDSQSLTIDTEWAAANPKLEPTSRVHVVCGVSDHGGKGSPFGAGCRQTRVYAPGFPIARWAHVVSAAMYLSWMGG